MGSYVTNQSPGSSGLGTDTTETDPTASGTTLTLSNTPTFIYGVYKNGVKLSLTIDYTISGAVITFLETLAVDIISVVYKY